jgi:hypothetical protein
MEHYYTESISSREYLGKRKRSSATASKTGWQKIT